MDRLWSPWRYSYVSTASADDECIFCRESAEQRDQENYILHRGLHNFVLLNLFPYTTGHMMIAPYAHVASPEEATEETLREMMTLTRDAVAHLRRTYNAKGLNIGMNLGECAGAGIAGHLHMHVLPRWPGDVNFMTAVGETRVLPEDLRTTYNKLLEAFRRAA